MKILYYKATIEETINNIIGKSKFTAKGNWEKEEFVKYYNYYRSNVIIGEFTFLGTNYRYSTYKTIGELIANVLSYDLIEFPSTSESSQLKNELKLTNKKLFIDLVEGILNASETLSLEERFFQCARNKKEFINFSIDVKQTYNLKRYNDYILVNPEFEVKLEEKKSLQPGFEFNSFDDFFMFIFIELIKQNSFIKKCANCGKYFYPKYRSDKIYCENPSPQDTKRTCRDYAFAQKRSEQLKNNEAMGLYKKIFMQKQMAFKRNPTKPEYAEEEKIGEDGEFYLTQGFSDQCFLIDAERIRRNKKVFSEKNRYVEKIIPRYGGNGFEKRMYSYIMNHNLIRIVSKTQGYIHCEMSEKCK